MLIELLIDYFKKLIELCLLGFELSLSLLSVVFPGYIFYGAFTEFKEGKIGRAILNVLYGIIIFSVITVIVVAIEFLKGKLWSA